MIDCTYLAKLKLAGVTNTNIAAKLGVSEQEVQAAWNIIMEQANISPTSGYAELCAAFTNMCHQYQLMGESLKVIGAALGNHAPGEEIQEAMFNAKKENTPITNLLSSFIVLRPFTPPDPGPISSDLDPK